MQGMCETRDRIAARTQAAFDCCTPLTFVGNSALWKNPALAFHAFAHVLPYAIRTKVLSMASLSAGSTFWASA